MECYCYFVVNFVCIHISFINFANSLLINLTSIVVGINANNFFFFLFPFLLYRVFIIYVYRPILN